MSSFLRSTLLTSLLSTILVVAPGATANTTFVSGPWSLSQHGTTGVAAMQLAIVSETKAIIYDKAPLQVEHNPLVGFNGTLAWAAEYDITTDAVRALNPKSNSFCAAGAFLSNGTLVDTGKSIYGAMRHAGDVSGLQGIRLFTPCDDGTCDIFENPSRVRLTSSRWYPSASRLDDGSIIIMGGQFGGGYINSASLNNPSYEFYPPKNINGHNGTQIPSQFLIDSLNANQFPLIIGLPDGTLFIVANTLSMIFNWRTNTETRLPGIPNGVRVTSPFSAGAVLLPLSPANGYTPEVLICGGSTISDSVSSSTISTQTPATTQCARIVLNAAGIAAGWEVETMPSTRVMPNSILLPDGRVLFVNGAHTGAAGYGNYMGLIGQSNADNPAFQGFYYDPNAPAGSRFSQTDLPTSNIARMYHSIATMTPNGTIMLAGSNPNLDVTTVKYATEYRVEWLSPSYLNLPRPTYSGLPSTINYGTTFTLSITLPSSSASATVALMDFGFSTHGVQMGQRLVQLVATLATNHTSLTIQAPPNATIYPPGPAFLFVLTDAGVPSFAHKTIIGTGASPPVDLGAIANMLAVTGGPKAAALAQPLLPLTGEGSAGEGSNVPTAPIPAPP
ncbi:glyoxal oxidase N-terminus-domain-containing protein [Gautieria morchelliformis]|nr:glyoxal oxidase N-terminus-domain-containing protein [Gautieria morchelliformis]